MSGGGRGDAPGGVAGGRRRPSLPAVAVAAVVVAAACGGGLLARSFVARQEQRLLRSEARQVALVGEASFAALFGNVDAVLTPLAGSRSGALQAEVGAVAAAEPAFGVQAAVYVPEAGTDGGFRALVAAGPGLVPGQAAAPATRAALASALEVGDQLVPPTVPSAVVHRDGHTTGGFARAVGPGSDEVLWFGFRVDPFHDTMLFSAGSVPFGQLRVALYASPGPDPRTLVLSTGRSLPAGAGVAEAPVEVGTARWLLAVEARSPLVGGMAAAAPWIVLVLGVAMAMVLGGVVEVLVRRHRYAARLVEERTAALRVSLADLQAAQGELVRGERLAALGEMATVVGQELRNPLTAVTNALHLLHLGLGERQIAGFDRHLTMAERQVARAVSLADDLTGLVRLRPPERRPVDLVDVVHGAVETTPAPPHVVLRVTGDRCSVLADADQLSDVVTHLLTHAYRAVRDGGTVAVHVAATDGAATLIVDDSGPAIDEGAVDRLFEPFAPARAQGTGLGLAIVRQLVEAHGGHVGAGNRPGGGLRIEVVLPAVPSEVAPEGPVDPVDPFDPDAVGPPTSGGAAVADEDPGVADTSPTGCPTVGAGLVGSRAGTGRP